MRIATSTTCTALIAAVVLAGCGATGDTSASTASNPSGTASAPSTSTTMSTTTPEAARQSSATSTSSTSGPVEASTSAASALVFEVGGKKLNITPTEVYCAGQPGTISHIVGKTNQRPPLVEADGKRLVMVKVGNDRPFKTLSPTGVSYTRTAVSFDQVDVGGGVLTGTMTCTSFEG